MEESYHHVNLIAFLKTLEGILSIVLLILLFATIGSYLYIKGII